VRFKRGIFVTGDVGLEEPGLGAAVAAQALAAGGTASMLGNGPVIVAAIVAASVAVVGGITLVLRHRQRTRLATRNLA
jgi:hypothetical protein